MNKELFYDLNYISNNFDYSFMLNKTILITGATGFIGSLLIKSLISINKKYDLNITVIAIARDKDKFRKVFKEFDLTCVIFHNTDLLSKISLREHVDYIIHTASPTTSAYFQSHPVETINFMVNSTINILEFAKIIHSKKVIYLSSMEAYGTIIDDYFNVCENDLGYLDLTNVRNCYPESKRLCECLCKSYSIEYNLNVTVARLSQVFGAGVSINDTRIFSQIAKSAILKNNIVLKTKGLSYTNSCYSTDAILAIFCLLVKGKNGEIYNINNEDNYMKIIDVANLVCSQICDNKITVEFDINNQGYPDTTKIHLNNSKMKKLGWIPKVSMLEMYERLIDYYKEELNHD